MVLAGQTPFVSICVPCYKYPFLLDRCLKSILSQTYTNYEIIITDDSPHNEIADLVNEQFEDSRIYYQKNNIQLGSPANWNESIRLAKGDYIKIMHHDDWFSQDDALEQFVKIAVSTGADFVCSNCVDHFPNKTRKHTIYERFKNKWLKDHYLILFANFVGAPSVTFFKRNLPDHLFDIKTVWFVDILFYYEYVEAKKIIFLDEYLLNITAGSETQITNNHVTGKIAINEFIYILQKHDLLGKAAFLTKLSLLELLMRYNIKSKSEFNEILDLPFEIDLPYYLLKIPVSHQVLNVIKHGLLVL